MSNRVFRRPTLFSGGFCAFLNFICCGAVNITGQIVADPFPYNAFPNLSNSSAAIFPMPLCRGQLIEEATIPQLQSYLQSGALTSVQLVECYLERIQQVDPYINSVLELNPDAMEIAAWTDALRRSNTTLGPLHGIPFLVKDNYATKDKMQTTAGSFALLGSVVPRDAHTVSRLRSAGAVLLGKAGLSEWADMRTNASYSEGYSARGGQVRTPYNLTMNPGGSSSGSGAAVAANIVPFALGTETDGSIISPAENCGVVGLKPTVGLTSRAGVVPESEHQDTTGPLAKTVGDAALVLDAIYGIDVRDNYTFAQAGKPPKGGFSQFAAGAEALNGSRFGLPWESFWQYADDWLVDELLDVVAMIESAGGTVVNSTELPHRKTIISSDGWNWDLGSARGYPNESEFTVVKVDFYNNIKTYLAELQNTEIKSLEDIMEYNVKYTGSEGGVPGTHPAFGSGQDSFEESLAWKGVRNETYWQAVEFTERTTREEGIDAALSTSSGRLDALLVPPSVSQTYQIAAQAGYPMLAIPVTISPTTGMPFAIGLMSTAWSEASLVKHGSALEDLIRRSGTHGPTGARRGRSKPRFLEYMAQNIPVL